jgi:hypothetical protein
MGAPKLGGRDLKRKVFAILKADNFRARLDELHQWPARQVINPLLSSLLSTDEQVKWRGVTALGEVLANLADQEIESARVVMRRLIWMLNDESGGIGWGVPETLGEIVARHEGLAREYGCLLVSYVREDGNFLEYEPLQRGAVWAIGRAAQVRPEIVRDAAAHLLSFLASSDATLQGLSVWALGLLGAEVARPRLEALTGDNTEVPLYLNGALVARSVGALAKEALTAIAHRS